MAMGGGVAEFHHSAFEDEDQHMEDSEDYHPYGEANNEEESLQRAIQESMQGKAASNVPVANQQNQPMSYGHDLTEEEIMNQILEKSKHEK